MAGLTIERFKHDISRMDRRLVLSVTKTQPFLCEICQPVANRLKVIIDSQEKSSFSAGVRHSTANIIVGDLRHIFSTTSCALCALILRLILRLKQQALYNNITTTGAGDISLSNIEEAFETIEDDVAATSSPDSDGVGPWSIEQDEGNIQVSVDAIPSTAAMSVWLPLRHTDMVNDEESQLFVHPKDFRKYFGNPPNYVFLPKPSDNATRNMDLMKQCLDVCQRSHTQCTQQLNSNMPSRLVDVMELKLIDVPNGSPFSYFALSYVWGTEPFFTLQGKNASFLHRPNALRDPSILLPKTITDAMAVTRSFGCRYIWIDSLCIIQDDEADKVIEVQRMHEIYANAKLTIVSAIGDNSNVPLMDIDPYLLSNQYHTIGDLRFCLDRPEFKDVVAFSTWATRGWTLQELVCSTRLLYFTPERTYYSCGAGNWNEDCPLDDSIPPEIYDQHYRDDDPKEYTFTADGSASSYYITMVEKISPRLFTKDEDVLKAVTGMYSMFMFESLGTAVSGLPVTYFEAALMWQPAGKLRRKNSDSNGNAYPSWSWAGWAGPIWYPFFEIDGHETHQINKWYLYSRHPDGNSNLYTLLQPYVGSGGTKTGTEKTTWTARPPDHAGVAIAGTDDIVLTNGTDPFYSQLPAILEYSVLLCHATTNSFRIQEIPGPEVPSRASLSFFAIYSDADTPIGEFKVDRGTLDGYFGLGNTPQAAELLPIANLDFTSERAASVVYMSKYGRQGQFSTTFMDLVEEDSDMVIVMWVLRHQLAAQRIGIGYMTRKSWSGIPLDEKWIVLR